ncbi:MAG TPA: AI-2E family transporter [Candidatus Polarisedimenticolia bacterium]|nr:AI-2E family transporter [Candidatus Polarisedimenticolia bacterium]
MTPLVRNLVAGAVVLIVLVGVYFARGLLSPFLLAAVIAYLLNPAVAALQRRGVRRPVGTLLVMGGLAAVVLGLLALMVPEMIAQVDHFRDRLPGYQAALRENLKPMEEYFRTRFPDQFEAIQAQAAEEARGALPAVAGWLGARLLDIMTSTMKLIVWLLTLIVIPVFSYFLLADYEAIRAGMVASIPSGARAAVLERTAAIDQVLRAWVKSQLTVALVLALIYMTGLSLLGVPLALVIGLIGGLANMVPYLGLVVGFFPAAILSFLDTGSWTGPLLVAGVFILGQALEATVITPFIVGSGLGMPPAVILLSVLVGGELFGFTGLLLAVPATAAGMVLLRDLRGSFDAVPTPSGERHRFRPIRRRRPPAT